MWFNLGDEKMKKFQEPQQLWSVWGCSGRKAKLKEEGEAWGGKKI